MPVNENQTMENSSLTIASSVSSSNQQEIWIRDQLNRIMAYASDDFDACLLFFQVLDVKHDKSYSGFPYFLVTKVVVGEEGRNQFSTLEYIMHSLDNFYCPSLDYIPTLKN